MNDAELRKAAQALHAKVHVGKAGVGEAAVAELDRHLKQDKLVKVKLLRSATHETPLDEQAARLAQATRSRVVDVRGHTAVFYRG